MNNEAYIDQKQKMKLVEIGDFLIHLFASD